MELGDRVNLTVWHDLTQEGGILKAIVEAWEGLIYVGDADLRIRFMNERFITALGRDATGEECYRALHGRDDPCPWCAREVFSGQRAGGFFQKPLDGRWYHVSNIPLPLPDGNFAKVAFIRESGEPESMVKGLPVFRNMVDNLSDAIFFHAPEDGRILYANQLACTTLGLSQEQLQASLPWDFSSNPPSADAWQQLVQTIFGQGVAIFEARHRHRDGTCIEVEVKATAVQAGLERFVVMVARDITERKLTAARLIEECNKVEAIMAATGDGITVQDRDLHIVYQNEVMIRRHGSQLGQHCYKIYGKRDSVCENCQVLQSFADGGVHRRNFTPPVPEKPPVHLEITSCPLRDASGEIVACVEVVRDVTQQRRLENSREEAFSAVSHEMRSPLTAVLGFAQYMQENATSPEQQQEYLGLVLREGERLKRLIDNLLSLQRLRAGFGLVNPGPVWPYPLLFEVAGHYRQPVVQQHIRIDCPPDVPPVLGESLKLQEALCNLLDNAVKYAPVESQVVIGARSEERTALLWVQDQGPGVPKAERERIFERFYRLEKVERPPGTGLGLALVREIALAHGGQVWVENAPEQGSIFYLSLPLAP